MNHNFEKHIDELIALHTEQLENLRQLKKSLLSKQQSETDDNAKLLSFTPRDIADLTRAYCQARADNADCFTFHGNQFVTGYAGYMLEYLTGKKPAC